MRVKGIWYQPDQVDAEGNTLVTECVIVEVPGPKRYLRLWLDQRAPYTEWGWVLHKSAIQLWPQEEEQDGAASTHPGQS